MSSAINPPSLFKPLRRWINQPSPLIVFLPALVLVLTAHYETALAQTPQSSTIRYEYDVNGNITHVIDPLGRVSVQRYGAFNQLIEQHLPSPAAGTPPPVIAYSYDARDQLTGVKDPRNLSTQYTVDGLGDQTALASPDSGLAIRTFDAAGLHTSSKDARGQLTTFDHDALGRITRIAYASGVPSTFEYDVGSAGAVGHLTKMSDESGQSAYQYDSAGRLIRKNVVIGTGDGQKSFAVGYDYGSSGPSNGKIVGMSYPSGNQIFIEYGEGGRVSAMSVRKAGSTTPVVLLSDIEYQASGPVKSWSWGNSSVATPNRYFREFDLRGRITRFPLGNILKGGVIRTITYDAAGRVVKTEHVGSGGPGDLTSNLNQNYAYDDLDRLTHFTEYGTSVRYYYDANGNRTQLAYGGQTSLNTIDPLSNRLQKTTGSAPIKTNAYDTAGNLISDGTRNYTYNARGRLQSAQSGTITATYRHNGLEQRAVKMVKTGSSANSTSETTYFIYDEFGQLIGEYDSLGAPIEETIYLKNLPIVVLMGGTVDEPSNSGIYYIYNDQINTPRTITDAIENHIVWRWDLGDPFGTAQPRELSHTQAGFFYNLRFPGQYYDKETNLHYNYYRDYDPQSGRYVQSDPIGLNGGINTYAYVENIPTARSDPLGLSPGDPYASANAAAIQAIKEINPMSIKIDLEIGGRIYRRPDGNYSYTWPAMGTQKDMGQIPTMCENNEGMYHTHGNYNGKSRPDIISGLDQYWADQEGKPIWAGTPSGKVLKFTPNGIPYGGAVEVIARGIK
ncbi:RHS repeat-associated protein [Duganella sp. 1411]|uniref:RHS repeat-associated core domain-containing protein n=1 Tax=Duganella sp. 1411 TaxID=2806572 RepID=UPI001AE63ECF|nr:RHS repeat-associated core domain-containing protein [Duganella sp. 1411]MBP1204106.1 RHS repeat-associated protein [Duganella sp. 1411]